MLVSQTATDASQLAGLEAAMTTEPNPERHWIERGPQKRLMLFSGRSHPALAQDIADKLGIELGAVELKTFANGETYCHYLESIRGSDVFLVQTGCPPVDRNLMELLLMAQAAKLASAKRITAVMPWFPYSRQEKKSAPREPISAKLVADFLQDAGVDRVLTMDLHAGQIQGFFDIPVDHMTALPLFAQYFRDKGLSGDSVVSVSPDPGRAKMARKFGQMLDCEMAVMNKTRPGARPGRDQPGDRRRRGQDRPHGRRHDRHRRHADGRRRARSKKPAPSPCTSSPRTVTSPTTRSRSWPAATSPRSSSPTRCRSTRSSGPSR